MNNLWTFWHFYTNSPGDKSNLKLYTLDIVKFKLHIFKSTGFVLKIYMVQGDYTQNKDKELCRSYIPTPKKAAENYNYMLF